MKKDGTKVATVIMQETDESFLARMEKKAKKAMKKGLEDVTRGGMVYNHRAPAHNIFTEANKGGMQREMKNHGERLKYYHGMLFRFLSFFAFIGPLELLSTITKDVDEDPGLHEGMPVLQWKEWTKEELEKIERVNEKYGKCKLILISACVCLKDSLHHYSE